MRILAHIALCGELFAVDQLDIPEGTKVRVRLEQQLSSATATSGQPVQLTVIDEVRIADKVAIAQGANVTGQVILSVRKRRMGRTGKLDFSIESVTAIDGAKIPLRYTLLQNKGGSHAVRNGVITAGVAVLFFPAAPFVLLGKGKDSTIQQGRTFEVFTAKPHSLIGKPVASAAATPAESDSGRVQISSEPANAEIFVDGAFFGNAPATIALRAGNHKILLKSGDLVWHRDLNVGVGSEVTLKSVLAKPE